MMKKLQKVFVEAILCAIYTTEIDYGTVLSQSDLVSILELVLSGKGEIKSGY